MRYAAIDMGTNTFHLIIGEMCLHDIKILHKTNHPVQLGEKTINEGYIGNEAIQRALLTLKLYKATMSQYGVANYRAVATSAVRSAKNGAIFVQKVKEEVGIHIEIISGTEEASLIFDGIQTSGSLEESSLIMDIGGGSTEFILANKQEILWKQSYNMGAARLWQQHFKEDPLPESTYNTIECNLVAELSVLLEQCAIHKPKVLVGSAGSFETYLQILDPTDDLTTPFKDIPLEKFMEIASKLRLSTHEERLKMEGIIPLRVDMIVAAAMLTKLVLDKTKIQKLRMTTYDLKMGVLKQLFKK